jgi:hypothetical protein
MQTMFAPYPARAPAAPPIPAPWRGRLADAAACALLLFIAAVDLSRFDLNWDTLAYHLPFAALRLGFTTPAQFTLPPDMLARFLGFPPLVDYVQGSLWSLAGRPEAVSLIAPLAILALALYLRRAFGLPMLLTVLVFLAVPILHTALDSGYTDLWTNAFFTIHLLAAWRLLTRPAPAWRDAAVSAAALAVAVESKEQYFVIGAVSLGLIVLLLGLRLWQARGAWAGGGWRALLVLLVCAPIAFYAPLRNLLLHDNPIYPVTVRVAGHSFPGTEAGVWSGPRALQNTPQVVRYVLSQLDLEATNQRPGGYTIDQGEQAQGIGGFRMGGSLGILLLGAATLLALGLRRRGVARHERPALAGAALLLVAVACFPGSNELRYFSFVEIVLLLAMLGVLRARVLQADAYSRGLYDAGRILLVSAALYTACLTGFTHLRLGHQARIDDVLRGGWIADPLRAALQHSDMVCYARPDPDAILYAPLFQARRMVRPYRFVWVHAATDCPAGAAVIR